MTQENTSIYEMIAHANNVGLANMSLDDLHALLIELRFVDADNRSLLEKYGYCIEIDRLVKDLFPQVYGAISSKAPKTYQEWVLDDDREEYKQLKEELRFMSKLYAHYASEGNVRIAGAARECMDNIKNRMERYDQSYLS